MIEVVLAGLTTVDVVQRVESVPEAGEKVQSASVETAAGGPAANAAVTVAALGGRAVLLTALGAHPLAELARDDLDKHDVEAHDLLPQHSEPPAVSAVTVQACDGERTVVSHNAAAVDLPSPSGLEALVARAGAVLVDGHHPRLALATAAAANRLGVPLVLDAGSYKPVLEELLPRVDVCACSATFRVPGQADFDGSQRALHGLGIPVVTRTQGAGPVTWSCRSPDTTVHSGVANPPEVPVRDTLGAGDVWHGALAYGIARLGRVPTADDLPALIRGANEVAAARVSRVGARTWTEDLRWR